MGEIKFVGEPDVQEREIPCEGKYFEVTWELNEVPSDNWLKEFDKKIKPLLETENNEKIGPYKPKIFFNELVSTISSKDKLELQKEFFIKEIFDSINKLQ